MDDAAERIERAEIQIAELEIELAKAEIIIEEQASRIVKALSSPNATVMRMRRILRGKDV